MITSKIIIRISLVLMFVILFILHKYSKTLYKQNSTYYPLNKLSKFIGFLGACNILIALGGDIRMLIGILVSTFMLLVLVHRKLGLLHSVIFSFLQVLSTPAALLWDFTKMLVSLMSSSVKDRGIHSGNVDEYDPQNLRQSLVHRKSIAMSKADRASKEMDKNLLK